MTVTISRAVQPGLVPAGLVPAGLVPAARLTAQAQERVTRSGPATRQTQERTTRPTVPAHVLPHRSPRELLTLARRGLAEAVRTGESGLRFATAHLAALRAATAVLAVCARPEPRRRNRVTSVWELLAHVAPELGEWAAFFASGASKRAAAEAGIAQVVTAREADDLIRAAEEFTDLVEDSLGLSHQPILDGLAS